MSCGERLNNKNEWKNDNRNEDGYEHMKQGQIKIKITSEVK